jgi:hypothetical protein
MLAKSLGACEPAIEGCAFFQSDECYKWREKVNAPKSHLAHANFNGIREANCQITNQNYEKRKLARSTDFFASFKYAYFTLIKVYDYDGDIFFSTGDYNKLRSLCMQFVRARETRYFVYTVTRDDLILS